MDNRIFNVNGKGEGLLLKVLEVAFEQSGCKCKGWLATDQGLVLMWYVDEKANKLPTSTGMTAAEVLPMVLSWLKSDEAKSVKLSDWDRNADHDGHNTLGWRVFCEDWGHVGGSSSAICAVMPAYMWHGK